MKTVCNITTYIVSSSTIEVKMSAMTDDDPSEAAMQAAWEKKQVSRAMDIMGGPPHASPHFGYGPGRLPCTGIWWGLAWS
jgi:hypothetical protein